MFLESPETISGWLYSGPGSGSLLAAAAAWQQLAGELGSAAAGYQAVIAELGAQAWSGPSAAAMAAAATPYVGWLTGTATQAEQAAMRAEQAAAAFEQARAAVVPPPVIAANRAQLADLVATNIFGQNTAAIAAVEAAYTVMWIDDVLAMTGYAAQSAAATTVTPFSQPPPTTNPAAGLGAAGAQVSNAGHTQLSQLLTAVPQALRGINPATGSPASLAAAPLQANTPSVPQLISYVGTVTRSIVPFNDAIKTIVYGMLQNSRNLNIASDEVVANRAAAESGSRTETLAASGAGASGQIGAGGTIGKLSVPAGWLEAAPEIKLAAAALPDTGAAAAPGVAEQLPAGVFGDLALAGLLGRSLSGAAPQARPAAIMNGRAQTRLERMVTELAGTHDVQHWHTDASRLDGLLEELSQKPGVHAVHVNRNGPTDPPLQPQSG